MAAGGVRENPALTPRPRRRRRLWRAFLALMLVGALALYLAREQILPAAARFLDVSDPPAKVDFALVLGGDTNTRPFIAAALYKAGLADTVLVTEPRPEPEVEDGLVLSELEVTRRVLRARGVPDEAIVTLPGACDSTFDEAKVLAKFLDGHAGRTVAVVTTNYHTRRARHVFQRVLGEQVNRVHFVAPPTGGFDDTNWWRFEAGFAAYTNEYAKLAYYYLRY